MPPVLTTLTQFEQYDLETEICDAAGSSREAAKKIVAEVLVPELEKRVRAAAQRALDSAAADISRMHELLNTKYHEVSDSDRVWMNAEERKLLLTLWGLTPFTTQLTDIVTWLQARSLRAAS